jgi:hypothetical protein
MAGVTFKKLAVAHNAASVSAGSDILAAVTVSRTGMLVIAVAVDTSTTVQLGVSDGSTTEKFDLNGGAALSAGVAYSFTWPAISGYAYSLVNKTGATATTIMHAQLLIEEAVG